MNAPAFLPAFLGILLILVAGYASWRVIAGPVLGFVTEIETDLLLLVSAIAGAGLVSAWAHTLPRGLWAGLFAAVAGYFAVRAGLARRLAQVRGRAIAHASGCLVLVYMFLAGVGPSTLQGSTAGRYTMAGMPGMYVDTTITDPALGLVCVAAIAFYAVGVVAGYGQEAAAGMPKSFAAGSVEACRVIVALVLADAILSKLV